jgi:hypothetical protein
MCAPNGNCRTIDIIFRTLIFINVETSRINVDRLRINVDTLYTAKMNGLMLLTQSLSDEDKTSVYLLCKDSISPEGRKQDRASPV